MICIVHLVIDLLVFPASESFVADRMLRCVLDHALELRPGLTIAPMIVY